jgi:hypothetical protein
MPYRNTKRRLSTCVKPYTMIATMNANIEGLDQAAAVFRNRKARASDLSPGGALPNRQIRLAETAYRSLCPNASPCRAHPTNDQLGRHSLKIVKLLTSEAEDCGAPDHADIDAFAVEYIAVHDRSSYRGAPAKRLRLLAGDSETNRTRAISPSPSALAANGLT